MVYNPATDFFGLWRNNGGSVAKLEMPGLDAVVSALARAGLITLSVSATPPVVSQSTTAWLQAAVPSYSAEGVMRLWDAGTSAYVAATPALLFKMLQVAANQSGTSWYTTAGGPPLNTVGNDGDFAIRTDTPNGIYGPKAAGAWPASPIPGTEDLVTSASLDNAFGASEGLLIYRGATQWAGLPIAADNSILIAAGGVLPAWEALSTLMDAVFGSTQGSVLYRDVAGWDDLGPGTSGNVLRTNGVGANPSWSSPSPEFPSGTSMPFYQAAAPPGWTKQTAVNDVGLRVVSGAGGGVHGGSAFSTVFAQTVVGDHTLTTAEMPSHSHPVGGSGNTPLYGTSGAGVGGGGAFGVSGLFTIGNTGGGASHNHSINLALAYVDIIIASKN